MSAGDVFLAAIAAGAAADLKMAADGARQTTQQLAREREAYSRLKNRFVYTRGSLLGQEQLSYAAICLLQEATNLPWDDVCQAIHARVNDPAQAADMERVARERAIREKAGDWEEGLRGVWTDPHGWAPGR